MGAFVRSRSGNGVLVLSRALRWALVGMTMSMLSNAVFEGSVIPSILLVGLPAWVIAFRKTFGLIVDFASPAAAWVVQRCGSFRSLAAAEGVEGVLCLAVALVPSDWAYWKWLLLTLSCLLLMTGQVIDVASEVFEVDAAAGDDDMLVQYSGYVGVISSVAGTLLGQVAGSAIANASITAMLLTSAVLSFGCAATRFRTRDLMPASTMTGEGLADDGSDDVRSTADSVGDNAATTIADNVGATRAAAGRPSQDERTAACSLDDTGATISADSADAVDITEPGAGPFGVIDHANSSSDSDPTVSDSRDDQSNQSERSDRSVPTDQSESSSRPSPSDRAQSAPVSVRGRLLVASLLLALIPSLWTSYAMLGLGAEYGGDALTVLYAFGGVGGILGSLLYMRCSRRLGMRRIAAIGVASTAASLAIVLIPALPAACATWLINGFGYGLLAQAVIVSRQLLLRGADLARFSGRARFAFAVGSAVGTWAGWLGSAHWQLLAAIALVLCAGFLPLLPALPRSREA